MNTLEVLRQFRILDYAIFDMGLAFLGMAIVAWPLSKIFLKMKIHVPIRSWIIWTLPIGIFAHLLVGTDTLMAMRFIEPNNHYILKIVIILLTILGFWGVKRVKTK